MKSKNFLLFSIVCLLMALSFYKTVDLLHINFSQTSEDKKEEKENTTIADEISMIGNTSGNYAQSLNNERGLVAYFDDFLYYNKEQGDKVMLIKTDSYTNEEDVLYSGNRIKNISALENTVVGTVTLANGNDILKDYIILLSKHGDSTEVLYKTESDFITSVICDKNTIYYTNESNGIYAIDLKTKEISTTAKISQKSDYPVLFAMQDNNLYYMDGKSVSLCNVISGETRVVSYKYTSILQQPILYKNTIYLFSDLKKKEIHALSPETGASSVLISETALRENLDAVSFNIGLQYLFMTDGEKVCYVNLDTPEQIEILKGFEPANESIFLTDDSIAVVDKEASFFPVNWIFSK